MATWIEKATFVTAFTSLLCTAGIGYMTYQVDAQTKRFEATGSVETEYYGVALYNYCGEPPVQSTGEPGYDLNDGFVRNEIWQEAVKRTSEQCDGVSRRIESYMFDSADRDPSKVIPEDQDTILKSSLVYIEVGSQSTLFSISPTLTVSNVRVVDGAPIWDYVRRSGPSESVPLGPIRRGVPIRVPVAIVNSYAPEMETVLVPRSISWVSPLNHRRVQLPVDYIVNGRHWRTRKVGVTVSGGYYP